MKCPQGIKFRAYPKRGAQQTALNRMIGHQRFIYNSKVDEERYFYAFGKKSLSLVNQKPFADQQYAQFKDKELTPFLYEVPSQVLRNGAYRFAAAMSRFYKKLAKAPSRKDRSGRQSVLLTSELFSFTPTGVVQRVKNGTTGEIIVDHALTIGTDKFPVGELKFTAHRAYEIPNTITVSRHNSQWFVSFNYSIEIGDEDVIQLSEKQLYEYFDSLTDEELESVTEAIDVGVVIPASCSNGKDFDFESVQKKRMDGKEKTRKRYQRQMARQKKGSRRRNKTRDRLAATYTYQRNVVNDFAHKVSHGLAESDTQVIGVEALKIANMTKRPKARKDENGNYIKNGAKAKAGLNKAILKSAWGILFTYIAYKCKRRNKLAVKVNPNKSSQECSDCEHTQTENRETQDLFVCKQCGYTDNADHNANKVLKKRTIAAIRAGLEVKQKKTTAFGGTKGKTTNNKIAVAKPGAGRSSEKRAPAKAGLDPVGVVIETITREADVRREAGAISTGQLLAPENRVEAPTATDLSFSGG
jgi:putative transposase